MAARPNSSPSVGAALRGKDFAHEQQALLDLIDKLQNAQLDKVKVPQIVVVGDQSAGKSSALEAITGTPFPRQAGACTRFATEIRLRRSNEPGFLVHIIPDRSRTLAEQARLEQFGGTVDLSTPFDVLMNRAVDLIAPKGIPGRFASKDVLVVEMSGPDMPLLTLVDLPGLVQNPNNDQSKEDIKAINDLTDTYMRNPRTIILAVIGGNGDYVQAPVLIKARHFDPTGKRTIGVLTKPDLTSTIGLEDKFIALVNNKDKENALNLGWFVLLNPGPNEASQSQELRMQREAQFFSTGKWSSLTPDMFGVKALTDKLSIELQRHIGKYVKTLTKEILKELELCEAELKSLGEGKDTVKEMREELVQLCSESKDLVNPAIQGTYKNPAGKRFFPSFVDQKGTPAQNLRARAVEENQKFAKRVRDFGQKLDLTPNVDPTSQAPPPARRPGTLTKEEFARREVEPLLQQSRGTEFPTDHNPRLVYTLFQNHSEKWTKLAQQHKENLGAICREFLAEVIDDVWPQRMREPLRKVFLDPQMNEMMLKAQKEVEILQKDQHFEVQPYDPEFEVRLKHFMASAPEGKVYTTAEIVLEKMLIHYDLSARIFIMNVITQVVERHLLQGLDDVFNPVKVWRMEDKSVEDIASENKQTKEKRLALKARKKAIEEARDVCTNLAMRKELRGYADEEEDEEDIEQEETPSQPSWTPQPPLQQQQQPARNPSRRTPPPPQSRANPQTPAPASIPDENRRSQYPTAPPTAYPAVPDPRSSTASLNPSYYPTSSQAPVTPIYAPPPPPPRPEKTPAPELEPRERQYYPPSPPDSGNQEWERERDGRKSRESFDAKRGGGEYSGSYPRSSERRKEEIDYEGARREHRGIFGKKR
jgi:GTPase SAR1 family protein